MRPFVRAPRRFLEDDRGIIAVFFAFSFLAFFFLLAATVDYARLITVQSRVQTALDGSLLQALRDRTGTDKVQLARNFMAAALLPDDVMSDMSVTYSSGARTMSATATLNVPMTVGSSWKPTTSVTVKSEVKSGSDAVRALDLVICVNASASASTFVGVMKSASNGFGAALDAQLATLGVPSFDQVRIRPIYYRDFGGFATQLADYIASIVTVGSTFPDPQAMGVDSGDLNALEAPADFFDASRDAGSFYNYASSIIASGGGDLADSGLECVNEAMESPWATAGGFTSDGKKIDIVYPMIAILNNAAAHPLNFIYSVQNPNYPASMPRDSATFASKWASARSAQPNLSVLLFSTMLPHATIYVDREPVWTPNGFLQLSPLSGFRKVPYVMSGSALITSLAQAVVDTYSTTSLTQ